MTLSTTANKVIALGNGVTTTFSYAFIIPTANDVEVIYTDATGAQTTLSPSLYTISGLGSSSGGIVIYPLTGSPIASGTSLTIARILPITQIVAISNQDGFYPKTIEGGMDRIVMEIQQIFEELQRTIQAPISDQTAMTPLPPAGARAGKALIFDASGNPIAGATLPGGMVSSAMQPFVASATIAAARALLGLGNMSMENIGPGLQDDGAGTVRANLTSVTKSSNYLILSSDHEERFIVTGPIAFTLPATSGLWDGFVFFVDVYAGTLTITPNIADSIEGNATSASSYIPMGAKACIYTDGAGHWRITRSRSFYSPTTPGGYLSVHPTMSPPWVNVTSSTIYYNVDVHGFVPVYNGAEWIDFPFVGLSCALNSLQQLGNSVHDVYVILVNGSPTLVIGSAWVQPGYGGGYGGFTNLTNASPIVCTASGHNLSNGDIVFFTGVQGNTNANNSWYVTGVSGANFSLVGSTGSGPYQAGSGTFAARGAAATIQRQANGGLWVNANSMTMYNGVTSYTVAAGQGTYVGTVMIDGTAGYITCHRMLGQARRWGVWNAYNRKRIVLRVSDPALTWTYSTNAWRQSDGDPNNYALAVTGLPDEMYECTLTNRCVDTVYVGVGYASTNYPVGVMGAFIASIGSTTWVTGNAVASAQIVPTIGSVYVAPIEYADGSLTARFYGNEGGLLLTVGYRG